MQNPTYYICHEDCTEMIGRMRDGEVDLTITSPPYDDLRAYNGYDFRAPDVIMGLHRITAEGGIVVWVITDQTIRGDETGTSFKHALLFQEAGFLRWDTMIWVKSNPMPTDGRQKRYTNAFEYMLVFSKGQPKTCNKLMVPSARAEERPQTYPARREKGLRSTDRIERPQTLVREERPRTNVWTYPTCDATNLFATQHPASYPFALARDHIVTWTNPGDLVFDPFMGSGTTAVAALQNDRRFAGCDTSKDYYDLACRRVWAEVEPKLFTEAEV